MREPLAIIDRLTAPAAWMASRFLGFFATPRRVLGMTLPARVALFLALFGILSVAAAVALLRPGGLAPDSPAWRDPRLAAVLVAVAGVLPFVGYHLARRWAEGDAPRFRDIEQAFRSGVATLEQKGIRLAETPLFLVTGLEHEVALKALIQSADIKFDVAPAADAPPAPLYWYANRDAVFLCLTDVSLVGQITRTLSPPASADSVRRAAGRLSKTIAVPGGDIGQYLASPPTPVPAMAGGAGRGTMHFPEADAVRAATRSLAVMDQISFAAPPPELEEADIALMEDRVRALCHLLRLARQPHVPVNGIISILPFRAFGGAGNPMPEKIRQAVASDLTLLRDGLQLRCPVTALVGGMETESGFRELVRRLGRDAVKAHRFGKGNDLWTQPQPELVEAVVRHACGAFEDWTYHLFTQSDGLMKPGNPKLYALLCRMRSELQEQLTAVLSDGYGSTDDPEALLFGGLYFAATGVEDDRQAFVKSVFYKVMEQEDELSWTYEAIQADSRYHMGRTALAVLNTVLLVAVLALCFMRLTDAGTVNAVRSWLAPKSAAVESPAEGSIVSGDRARGFDGRL
ncbi:type VI secretion protein IcmF/TssM N-terminal domain-containing protein [Planctomyces sp. SH-PL14]|uniref:type VI secretion protein IcmF/TssM N-terminal domain-containing protein n=1 Tax=Planctomyces sp. SH-PL14 TaxID=1632864 RepID=UPI00078BEBA0|nr:type VI secretion protein IcmF/TssM N-terminal domain-containing protein [Planctomyces sp. SH-PL14]AMV20491.1 hypothetical protein VT03_21515 [Planctomyces sp. SH-PL14]